VKASPSKSGRRALAHKTVPMTIAGQPCRIDKGIVPTIEWLLGRGATTLFCCQGHHAGVIEEFGAGRPYVIFVCPRQTLLAAIIGVLDGYNRGFAPAEIRVDMRDGRVRYTAEWRDHEHLLEFQAWLRANQ
jgi:hypothetical protein